MLTKAKRALLIINGFALGPPNALLKAKAAGSFLTISKHTHTPKLSVTETKVMHNARVYNRNYDGSWHGCGYYHSSASITDLLHLTKFKMVLPIIEFKFELFSDGYFATHSLNCCWQAGKHFSHPLCCYLNGLQSYVVHLWIFDLKCSVWTCSL